MSDSISKFLGIANNSGATTKRQVGDVFHSPSQPAGALPCKGGAYLKSAYPLLAAKLGDEYAWHCTNPLVTIPSPAVPNTFQGGIFHPTQNYFFAFDSNKLKVFSFTESGVFTEIPQNVTIPSTRKFCISASGNRIIGTGPNNEVYSFNAGVLTLLYTFTHANYVGNPAVAGVLSDDGSFFANVVSYSGSYYIFCYKLNDFYATPVSNTPVVAPSNTFALGLSQDLRRLIYAVTTSSVSSTSASLYTATVSDTAISTSSAVVSTYPKSNYAGTGYMGGSAYDVKAIPGKNMVLATNNITSNNSYGEQESFFLFSAENGALVKRTVKNNAVNVAPFRKIAVHPNGRYAFLSPINATAYGLFYFDPLTGEPSVKTFENIQRVMLVSDACSFSASGRFLFCDSWNTSTAPDRAAILKPGFDMDTAFAVPYSEYENVYIQAEEVA